VAGAVAGRREEAEGQAPDRARVAVLEAIGHGARVVAEVRREEASLPRRPKAGGGVVGSLERRSRRGRDRDRDAEAFAVARGPAGVVGVVVGQEQLPDPPRVEAGGPHVGEHALHPFGRSHPAVDERELVPAVEEVRVGVEVGGDPEAGERPSAHQHDIARQSHDILLPLALQGSGLG